MGKDQQPIKKSMSTFIVKISMYVSGVALPGCLKTKMCELRLYCDLLVQQVQTVQSQHASDPEDTPTSEVIFF